MNRQQSIDFEIAIAVTRIDEAMSALCQGAGLDYSPVPTEAVNSPDLLHLQQVQHIAGQLEQLADAGKPSFPATKKKG